VDDLLGQQAVRHLRAAGPADRQAEVPRRRNRWLDWFTVGVNGEKVRTSPGGMVVWTAGARCATRPTPPSSRLVYSDHLDDATAQDPATTTSRQADQLRARRQPAQVSYVIGFGANSPKNPHHRYAHGPGGTASRCPSRPGTCSTAPWSAARPRRTTRTPTAAATTSMNEVATDYNAGFTSALARLYGEYGGAPAGELPAAGEAGPARSCRWRPR
jgi:hypothetical protein